MPRWYLPFQKGKARHSTNLPRTAINCKNNQARFLLYRSVSSWLWRSLRAWVSWRADLDYTDCPVYKQCFNGAQQLVLPCFIRYRWLVFYTTYKEVRERVASHFLEGVVNSCPAICSRGFTCLYILIGISIIRNSMMLIRFQVTWKNVEVPHIILRGKL